MESDKKGNYFDKRDRVNYKRAKNLIFVLKLYVITREITATINIKHTTVSYVAHVMKLRNKAKG